MAPLSTEEMIHEMYKDWSKIMSSVTNLTHTVYGRNGDDGLKTVVNDHKHALNALKSIQMDCKARRNGRIASWVSIVTATAMVITAYMYFRQIQIMESQLEQIKIKYERRIPEER